MSSNPTELERPQVAPPQAWSFPTPAGHDLPNGLRLLAYDTPGQYVISVRLSIPLTLSAESRDKEGVAAMMARLLDEGTARHTSEEFAELLERNGIGLGAGVSEGDLTVDLDVPKRFLPQALDLTRQAVAEPAFGPSEVTRILRTRLAEIEQERASAPHRAAKEFAATFYEPAERASRPGAGTRETISAITREDIAAFHASHVGPSGATVVVAGDLAGLDLPALLGDTLGRWASPEHEPSVRPPAAPRRADDAARIVIVDRPGSVQSELSVGCSGPDRHAEGGWAAYPVLSFVIGGSPTARVDAVLREEKGYTYGIRSGFRPRRSGGLFVTSGSVRADATVDALTLLLEILDGAREGFTDQEIEAGVDFISKTAPGRYATADAVANEAAMLVADGLPLDFTSETLVQMSRLRAADCARAYNAYADGRWTIVVVGDAEAYSDPVRALGRGVVTVVPA